MDEATGLCFLDIGPATRQGLTCETSLGTRQDLYWAGFGSDLQPYVKHWPEATLHRLENGRLSDRGNLNLVDRWESFQLDKAGGSTVLRHPSMTCGIPLLTAQGTLAAVVLDASQTSSPTRILEFVPVESLRRVALLREPIALDSEDNRRASFRSLSAMLSKLPANARPAKNETEWAGDAAAAANQWLSKYVVGQFFELNSRLVVLTQPDYYPSLRPGNSSLLLLPTDVPTVSTVPGRPPIRVLSLFFLADAHNRAVVDLANKQTRDPQLQRFVANAKFRGRVQRAFVPTVEEKRRTIREFEQATSSPYDFLLKKSGPMSIEFHDLVVVVGDLELIGP
jgi:hypothetical protein